MGAMVSRAFHYVRVGPNRADDEEDHGEAEHRAPGRSSVHTPDPTSVDLRAGTTPVLRDPAAAAARVSRKWQ